MPDLLRTANPVEVVVAETDQGRGVLGVIDRFLRRGSRARMTSRGRRISFDSRATSCEQRKELPINLLRNVRSGSTGPFIACIRDARPRRNPRIRPKSAFSRFAPLHRPDLVGQLRVEGGRSRIGGRLTGSEAAQARRRELRTLEPQLRPRSTIGRIGQAHSAL